MNTIIFDFDGTLVASMPVWADVMVDLLKRYNITYTNDVITTITPLSIEETSEYFRDTLGVPLTASEIQKFIEDDMKIKYRTEVDPKPGVMTMLATLMGMGYRLCILTSTPHELFDGCVLKNNMSRYFDYVWSIEDFGVTKANPEIYKLVAERLNCTPQDILFVDDNPVPLECAKGVGMTTCCAFDECTADIEQEMREKNDYYVKSFKDFVRMITE